MTQTPVTAPAGVVVHRGVRPNSPELLQLYRDADAFVLPSQGECLAVVLMEASAAGLPIIATDVGALAEAAVNDRTAIVIPARDGRALRAAIERMVDDDALRSRYGNAGHALARAKFDADRNCQLLIQLIASVTRAGAGRRAA